MPPCIGCALPGLTTTPLPCVHHQRIPCPFARARSPAHLAYPQAYERVNYRVALSAHAMATFHSCVQPGNFKRDADESAQHCEDVGVLKWKVGVTDCTTLFKSACTKAVLIRLCVGRLLALDCVTAEAITSDVLSYLFSPAPPLTGPAEIIRLIAAQCSEAYT